MPAHVQGLVQTIATLNNDTHTQTHADTHTHTQVYAYSQHCHPWGLNLRECRDAMGGSSVPKSAGSTLRRYNEAALQRDISELLESWAQGAHVCMPVCMYVCVCVYVSMYDLYVFMHEIVLNPTYTCIRRHTYSHTQNLQKITLCTYMHTHIHLKMRIHIHDRRPCGKSPDIRARSGFG